MVWLYYSRALNGRKLTKSCENLKLMFCFRNIDEAQLGNVWVWIWIWNTMKKEFWKIMCNLLWRVPWSRSPKSVKFGQLYWILIISYTMSEFNRRCSHHHCCFFWGVHTTDESKFEEKQESHNLAKCMHKSLYTICEIHKMLGRRTYELEFSHLIAIPTYSFW